MAGDISEEVSRLLSQGKEPKDIRIMLEQKGYAGQDIAAALETSRGVQGRRRNSEDDRNSKFLLTREVFDRIGYGAATPQFVNILFWLSAQSHPYIIFIIGVLNGLKTVSSVFFSNLLQAYDDRHKISKNSIAMAGIIFGFSFLGMAFAILLRNIWVFSASFLLGSVAIVAYGDLYQRFVNNLIRKERRMPLLRSAAYWGVLITGASLLLTGWLLDKFPMSGVPWEVTLFGITYSLKVYGYLLAFEITAFSFILAGYITSLLSDRRDLRSYRFFHFLREQHRETLKKLHVFWSSKYVALMTLASVFTG
ncbi:hypothetical protein GOV11_02210, partial [Candidatus Woesearchaeota archaeon]|nr:hypothetical protein [Candidatus Woesearchaeota archaeon]